MAGLLQDLRTTLRTLTVRPGFTLLVLVTLGIGVGASTAIFSVANAVLFRPLPLKDPDRLVFVWNRLANSGVDKSPVAAPDVIDYQEQTTLFEGLVGMSSTARTLVEDGSEPEPVVMGVATPELLSLFGFEPLLGKMYGPEDEGKGEPTVTPNVEEMPALPVILSYGFWQRRYGGDPEVLGRRVEVNGQSMFIQGVAPKEFQLLMPADAPMSSAVDAWVPTAFSLRKYGRSTQWMTVVGRLKKGVTLAEAQREMDNIAAYQRESFEFHRNVNMEIRLVPMYEDLTHNVRPFLLALLGASTFLLLLTFSNVTNLLLLRTAARQKEISIRGALGGTPGRLVGHVLVEGTFLALAGGALGVLMAHWGIRLFLSLQPEGLPRVEEASIDVKSLAVALAITLLAALLCALATAWWISHGNLAETLTARSSTTAPNQQRLRKALVVVEIALSLLLLAGTGLVFRTFNELSRIDPGFDTENVLTAKISLPFFKYRTPAERSRFQRQFLAGAAALPGVRVAGAGQPLPLTEDGPLWWGPWSVEGMSRDKWAENEADYRQVMPDYFTAMGIPLLAGRLLEAADNLDDARPVVVVDDVFARRAWPGKKAVGQRLMLGRFDETGSAFVPSEVHVVGVVAHVRYLDLTRDGRGTVYIPLPFWAFELNYLTLKSETSDPMVLANPLHEMLQKLDPDLRLVDVCLMQDYVDEALAPNFFALVIITSFASIAVILASVGLYGVMASAVRQRRPEIGIRMTFGATMGQILWTVLRQGLTLTAIGVPLGLLAAFLLTQELSSLLYGVTPTDPLTFAVIVILQVFIATVASLIPAWRATKVDPVQILRSE